MVELEPVLSSTTEHGLLTTGIYNLNFMQLCPYQFGFDQMDPQPTVPDPDWKKGDV